MWLARSVRSEYVPSSQGKGTPVPSGQKWPGVHATHTVALVVPPLYLPAAQSSHLAVLRLGAMVPGPHGICLALPVVA